MAVTFDPKKNSRNIAERGLSFEEAERLEWNTALIRVDRRRDYGEPRLQVLAMLDGRLHVAIVTPRAGDIRVISFRKANAKEAKVYEQNNR